MNSAQKELVYNKSMDESTQEIRDATFEFISAMCEKYKSDFVQYEILEEIKEIVDEELDMICEDDILKFSVNVDY